MTTAAFVLALDQGTTSSRALVFDAQRRVLGRAQREVPQHYPQPGQVEHDPEVLWATQLAAARAALGAAGVAASDLAAIGVTNQRETTVLWDRATGAPLAPAIVWQDRRTADVCAALQAAGAEADVTARTGLVLDPYFSATKLAWLLDRIPGARARAARGELAAGTVDTWLIWKLTGGAVHATDVTNASRTLLMDLTQQRWDDALLARFDVPRAVLPTIVASSGVVGHARVEHFGAVVPIAGIAGDQQAALFGQRCTRPGEAKNTIGTGGFLLLHTGDAPVVSRHRLLSTTAAVAPGRPPGYALEGSVFVAGAAVQWLRDGLGLVDRADAIEALAASVPDSGGVHLVPAFTGLGAPHWDADARGLICGLTRGTTRAHIARAALDAIAQQTADVVDAMRADAGLALARLRVDGGATRNDLLLQIHADLLQVPVVRAAEAESTAVGAALLAGLGVGLWRDEAALDAEEACAGDVFEPRIAASVAAQARARWADAVRRARG
ncbi:MAG: glycerol kinase GlpK [Burkholderiales bacterium]|jgi:glycerol kinase|nr:glycerol kinase GlpK [Burkholderiales bacterium]